ncbi:putative lipoprotein [Leptospira borgpetersenii serovar Mini str. 201000851]|nr:putative lipoprotein [Leptospira borgpetersenii str. 200801926]ENO65675.1 putative lipoprotein [Leptospira borgpetersenii serovar Mini str. 201000851]
MKKHKFELKINALFSSILFLFISCNKDKDKDKDKDNQNDLLLAAILLHTGINAEFRISDTNALATAYTTENSSRFKVRSTASKFLTDLGGDNPQNYRDGVGDGFNDHFITPSAVSIGVYQVLAYKSVEKGGPAKETETLENANFIMFQAPGRPIPGSKVCATGFMPIGLETGNSSLSSAFLPISPIPDNEQQDYDRVGIIACDFTYYFDPKDVPENSYRYVDLVLNNPIGSFSSDLSITRGDVSPKLFNKNCPSSFTNSSSFIHSDLLKSENVGNDCNMGQLAIDSSSGRILKAEVSDEYNPFTNPERTLNPPSVAATDYTSAVQKLKFKTPAIIDNLDKKDPYILVIDLDFSKKTKVSYSTFLETKYSSGIRTQRITYFLSSSIQTIDPMQQVETIT